MRFYLIKLDFWNTNRWNSLKLNLGNYEKHSHCFHTKSKWPQPSVHKSNLRSDEDWQSSSFPSSLGFWGMMVLLLNAECDWWSMSTADSWHKDSGWEGWFMADHCPAIFSSPNPIFPQVRNKKSCLAEPECQLNKMKSQQYIKYNI